MCVCAICLTAVGARAQAPQDANSLSDAPAAGAPAHEPMGRGEQVLEGAAKLLGLPDMTAPNAADGNDKNLPDVDKTDALGPDARLFLEGDRGWPAGTVREQLDKDSTLVPYGKGAIFVPAMTQGLDEPPVTVWLGNDKVADSTSGIRIVVAPGEYFVQLGSGTVETRFGRVVQVKELKTTVVPVTWSGLTVHVVDAQLNSLRNSYEIIRMNDREYIGAGFGADEQAGEPVATWVLRPGLYKIVRVGGTYRDRTDFATVRLIGGQHTQYLLVQDPDTGTFQGAGEARPEELFRPGRGVYASLILGGDASLNARQSVIGYPDGNGYALQGFIDTKLNGQFLGSPMLLRLQVAQGQTRLPQQIWQKTQDVMQMDYLYVYNYKPWAGPYVRGKGVTNLFSSVAGFLTPVTAIITNTTTGAVTTRDNVHSLKLTGTFGSLSFREGIGLNWRLFKTIAGEMTLRTGLGYQQTYNHNLLQETSSVGSVYNYSTVPSGNIFGLEATLIAVGRLTRYVVLNVVIDTLVPFSTDQGVDLQVEGSLAFKLTQFASVNYVLNYHRGPLIPTPIIEQDVLLRFSLEIL